jgi:hypothetical protein
MSFHRNADSSLPASHTVEMTFIPPDFSSVGVSNLPGILLKSNEQARSTPAGLAVKIINASFWSACPMSTPTASAMSSSRRSAPGSICRGSTPISAAPSWRSRRERQANALYNAAFAAVDALRMFRACVHRSPKRRGRAMTGALPNDLYATPRGPAAAPHRASAQARPRDLDRRRRLARSAAGHASRDRPIRGVVRRCLRRTVRAAPMMT